MTMQNDNNLYQDVFEGDPLGRQSLFLGHTPQQARTPFQQSSFASMFEPTFNRYLGLLGSQIRTGAPPTTSFSDFLGQQDFGRQFRRFGGSGSNTSQFTSPTRFFFGGR